MKKNKFLSLLIAAVLVFSLTAGTAYAAGTAEAPKASKAPHSDDSAFGPKNSFKNEALKRYETFFDKLVADGTINAAQKDTIKAAIETAVNDARQSGTWKIDMSTVLAGLVKDGKITAAQKTAVENALKAERLQAMQLRMKAVLDKQVSNGTITAEQAKAILSAMTDAVNNAGGRIDMSALLGDLVKAGKLSAEQQTALEKAMKPPHDGKEHHPMKSTTPNAPNAPKSAPQNTDKAQ